MDRFPPIPAATIDWQAILLRIVSSGPGLPAVEPEENWRSDRANLLRTTSAEYRLLAGQRLAEKCRCRKKCDIGDIAGDHFGGRFQREHPCCIAGIS